MYQWLITMSLADLKELRNGVAISYGKLMGGKSARVMVDQNGERVEFIASRSSDLAAYLAAINMAIAKKECRPLMGGPIAPIFRTV